MKNKLVLVCTTLLFCGSVLAQPDDEFLPGLQSNVVRAQLVPLQKAIVSAGISAILKTVDVQEGEHIDAGARLLSFDCDALHAAGDIVRAKVASATAVLKVNRQLLQLNSVGPLEVALNKAELAMAEGELASVTARLKHCIVEAPFDGVVTQRVVDPHQFVAEGESLLELVSRESLEARMLMPSTSLSWLSVGSGFSMLVEELNVPMRGRIVRIGGTVDPISLTIQAFGRLTEQDERLLPGMSGRVQFIDAESD